jgi:hypothetical protein
MRKHLAHILRIAAQRLDPQPVTYSIFPTATTYSTGSNTGEVTITNGFGTH